MLLPLQGEVCTSRAPGAMPRAMYLLAFQAAIMPQAKTFSASQAVFAEIANVELFEHSLPIYNRYEQRVCLP